MARTYGISQPDGSVLFSNHWPNHSEAQRRILLSAQRDNPCERCGGTGDGIGWREWICRDCNGTGETP